MQLKHAFSDMWERRIGMDAKERDVKLADRQKGQFLGPYIIFLMLTWGGDSTINFKKLTYINNLKG